MTVPVIETPFALFEVQVESLSRHAVELLSATLGITPEALNAVDVTCAVGELVSAMINSKDNSIDGDLQRDEKGVRS